MVSEFLKPSLAPTACRLCGRSNLDGAVQGALIWEDSRPAHRLSDVLLFGIVPGAAFGSVLALGQTHGGGREASTNALVLGETLVLTSLLTQLTKFTAARERPFVRTKREHGEVAVLGPDDNLSFFSGHTSITFALAVGAGSIASFRGYDYAPLVWGLGMPLAMLTGYLRIAADRHYFTDVLTGALVGSAIGVLIPWLHRHYASDGTGPMIGAGAPGVVSLTWVR